MTFICLKHPKRWKHFKIQISEISFNKTLQKNRIKQKPKYLRQCGFNFMQNEKQQNQKVPPYGNKIKEIKRDTLWVLVWENYAYLPHSKHCLHDTVACCAYTSAAVWDQWHSGLLQLIWIKQARLWFWMFGVECLERIILWFFSVRAVCRMQLNKMSVCSAVIIWDWYLWSVPKHHGKITCSITHLLFTEPHFWVTELFPKHLIYN